MYRMQVHILMICIIKVKLENPKDPDNVNWYKVTDDGDELLDDTDNISIEKGIGSS